MHPMTASAHRQAWRKLAASTLRNLPRSSIRPPTAHCGLVFRRNASSSARLWSQQQKVNPAARPTKLPTSNTARRSYSSGAPPPKGNQNIKFWPFVAVIALGSGGYMLLVNRRKDMPAVPSAAGLAAPAKSTPTFSPKDVTVLFVLGGPGAGKGTQCARLVSEYGFTHLSAGDLLRAEQERPGSEFGELIKQCIKDGAIVPMEVTVQLLENAMTETIKNKHNAPKKFLIDGFPRKMDQAFKFEEVVCPARLVLFYDCPEAEMERRLMERGKTSGRADDNAESIRKRFRTFIETSMPVVDHYEKEGRVVKIDATPTPDSVFQTTRERLTKALGDKF
ncbi:adenylate kinase-domain-containing protein [Podospora aff. communis PSN243]|uniref:Uridylate kinase n=1 Tax=Podospora aff. communis PSN243 TaxID=3040156 RepID=A0AAV9H436_9PEZI|nr:adenylate kinase-domain-containing protein [Podospora aff. communis PSN243]